MADDDPPPDRQAPAVGVRAAGAPAVAAEPPPAFYLDLASPECYLAAERILTLMPVPVGWIPVHLAPPPVDELTRARIARTAAERHIQDVRWPPPFDARFANLTATYAKSIGRVVAFTQAALRQAYAGGRDLSITDNVLIAASACEMHPTAILKAAQTRGPQRALDAATRTAQERGVRSTPAVWLPPAGGDPARVLHGDTGLEEAAALLSARSV